mmetsp:Transcript_11647/g.29456  ORF Transcript_11647/g.29456 Transcript_11647/m.29456 type:complete len:505 (+) Transcript_11647:147-1661(+)
MRFAVKMSSSYKGVQNGSDVRGVVLGEKPTLTPRMVRSIAAAFALSLEERAGGEAGPVAISVGKDSRVTGDDLSKEAMAGAVAAGADVYDLGLATTPACFMSTITPGFGYSGSIMLTASHLPYDRNGMKFFTPEGGLGKDDISAILALAEKVDKGEVPVDGAGASSGAGQSKVDFMATYAAQLRERIVAECNLGAAPLEGLKIVVDAGNGAGGFFARDVLAPLGADVSASQFLEPDGMFPNHVPNPEDKEAMASIQRAVVASKADLGVIFDTDVDRSAVVDASGTLFNKNRLIAAMAAIVLRDSPGATVVTDSVTSDGLARFIAARGGKHLRFKRGYKNVIEKGKEVDNCPLMIETSGHGALSENHYLDDGAYMAVKMIVEAARQKGDLGALVRGFEEPLESAEFRVKYSEDAPADYGAGVVGGFEAFCSGGDAPKGWVSSPDNFEGWRASVLEGKGWVLIRKSLHDPLLVINIESDEPNGVAETKKIVVDFLAKYEKLDLSHL